MPERNGNSYNKPTNRLAVDVSTRGTVHIHNMTRADFDRMPGIEQCTMNDGEKQFLYGAPAQFYTKTYRLEGDVPIEVICFTNEPPARNHGFTFGVLNEIAIESAHGRP